MIRFSDIVISLLLVVITFPIQVIVYVILLFDVRSPIFIQQRVGLKKELFRLVKFRTMAVGTKSVGTHLVNPDSVTRFGKLLRTFKIDELPQLYNVLIGDMSLVGPRPCLPSQVEVIKNRSQRGVFDVKPGITGLSQLSGVDMSQPEQIARVDQKMIQLFSFNNYLKYILMTGLGKGSGDPLKGK